MVILTLYARFNILKFYDLENAGNGERLKTVLSRQHSSPLNACFSVRQPRIAHLALAGI